MSTDTLIVRYGVAGQVEPCTVEISIATNAPRMRAYGSEHPLDMRIITQHLARGLRGMDFFVCESTDGRTVVIPPKNVISIEECGGPAEAREGMAERLAELQADESKGESQ